MDSEHRHELEENALARWLAVKVDEIKPLLPAILVGVIALTAGVIGLNAWRAANAEAKADRWRDFAIALEKGNPDLIELKRAAEANPGAPVADWAEVTWADGKLFEASSLYFRNRQAADEAIDDAAQVYERLAKSADRDVAERAGFQLGRALELQGKLEDASKQYARVTGAFAQVAKSRIEQLESPTVKESYAWITATKTASASSTVDTDAASGGLEPDDIPLPEMNAADAEATLDDLLKGVESNEAEESAAAEEDSADSATSAEEAASTDEADDAAEPADDAAPAKE